MGLDRGQGNFAPGRPNQRPQGTEMFAPPASTGERHDEGRGMPDPFLHAGEMGNDLEWLDFSALPGGDDV